MAEFPEDFYPDDAVVEEERSYIVSWAIDVTDIDAKHAAENAATIMKDIAFESYFFVMDAETGESFDVDLSGGESEPTNILPGYISEITKQDHLVHMDQVLDQLGIKYPSKVKVKKTIELGD